MAERERVRGRRAFWRRQSMQMHDQSSPWDNQMVLLPLIILIVNIA